MYVLCVAEEQNENTVLNIAKAMSRNKKRLKNWEAYICMEECSVKLAISQYKIHTFENSYEIYSTYIRNSTSKTLD